MSTAMTSSRPYLVRALYEWILDNDCTPHVVVDALLEGVEVPQEHVKDGQIVLNVSPVAVQDLSIDDHYVSFNGRFAGVSRGILVPMGALLGIYARENGAGMMFKAEAPADPEPPTPLGSGKDGSEAGSDKKKPALRLVK